MIKLTTFASGDDFIGGQRILTASALAHGVDQTSCWSREDIVETDFYRANKRLLDAKRGVGYWAWKPYLILEELRALQPGDVLIYCDSGKADNPYLIDSPLEILVEWCIEEVGGMLPGVYAREWGLNKQWTKGECFDVLGCDTPAFRNHCQIQATFSVWQHHARSIEFLSEWLHWCTVPAAISDERVHHEIPDDDAFIDHRHDQSIITLLSLQQGLKCYGEPDEITPLSKNMSSLVDRIAGRTWSMRRRMAFEERRLRYDTSRGGPVISYVRRVKRYIFSMANAVRAYP